MKMADDSVYEAILKKETDCLKFGLEEGNKVIVPRTLLGYWTEGQMTTVPNVAAPAIMSSCLQAGGVDEYKSNLTNLPMKPKEPSGQGR